MKINTTRFGEIEVNEKSIYEMASPILGFDAEDKFVLVEHNKENSNFKWFQSMKTPSLAFVLTMAGFFGIDYTIELPDDIATLLDVKSADDVLVFNIAVIPTDNPKAATINLMAPIIFNINTNKAAQAVLAGTKLRVDYPLFKKEAIC